MTDPVSLMIHSHLSRLYTVCPERPLSICYCTNY